MVSRPGNRFGSVIGSGRDSGRDNLCRKLSLLGIAHPVEGSLFQVQGAIGKAALIRGRFEKKANMWLCHGLCETCIKL